MVAISQSTANLEEIHVKKSWLSLTGVLAAALIGVTAFLAASPARGVSTAHTPPLHPYYTGWLVNESSSYCLGLPSNTDSSGGYLIQDYCAGTGEQIWAIRDKIIRTYFGNPATGYQLENIHTGLCLGLAHGSTAPGTALVQGRCSGTSDLTQFWLWIPYQKTHLLLNGENFACTGISGSSDSVGAKVVLGNGCDTSSLTQDWANAAY
jgi:hypothetical protein